MLKLKWKKSCDILILLILRGPVKTHIHTVVRTPNGNDYGKDLLKEHLEQHHKHEKE